MIRKINETLLYKDTFFVLRPVKERDEHGGMTQRLEPVGDLTAVPCRVSRKTRDDAKMSGEIVNDVEVALVMFTDPRHKVLAGDTVDILHQGKQERYLAGEPYPYDYHQEVELYRKGEA
ncbi:MAG: hypothetical protein U0M15_02300 [Bacillota bacterium]|nr:hypothetical protein [Bacillota bacterium]